MEVLSTKLEIYASQNLLFLHEAPTCDDDGMMMWWLEVGAGPTEGTDGTVTVTPNLNRPPRPMRL